MAGTKFDPMKYFLAGLLFFSQPGFCQQVTGVVVNGNDNTKLVAASVFINNSSKGSITNSEGRFVISGLTETNFEMVISYTGFATVSINITPQSIHEFLTVKLLPRKKDLEEISITAPEKDGWKHWGNLFTELFIGVSDFAGQCSIANPKVLKFLNDKNTSVLRAYSNAPLIIHNKALGYDIKYQLEDFSYDFKKRIISYLGYTGFDDMAAKNKKTGKKWRKNRHEAYEGSMLHFMRALYRDSLQEGGFVARQKIRIYAGDSIFSRLYRPESMPKYVKAADKIYRIRLGPVATFKKDPSYLDLIDTAFFSFKDAVKYFPDKKQKIFFFNDYLEIIYKNTFLKSDYLQHNFMPSNQKVLQSSTITFVGDFPITIEENGLFYNPLHLLSTGYWGWIKMAETLPSDYIDNK